VAVIGHRRPLVTIVLERDKRTGGGAVRDGQPAFAHETMIPKGAEHRTRSPRRRPMTSRLGPIARVLALLVAIAVGAACGADTDASLASVMPVPSCGGLKVAIDPALPCERLAEIAVATLGARAPQQLARGVAAIDVVLATCPRNEIPQQVTCGDAQFVQLVTVTFGPAGNGGPIERSLTVAIEPVTGAILGIENPLIR
jgi:hypothetical protein